MAADAATSLSEVRFLTVAEVATIMRVSKMTVYRLVHSGELEAIRVGRSFRVPEQAVNQYLRAAFVSTALRCHALAYRGEQTGSSWRLGAVCRVRACPGPPRTGQQQGRAVQGRLGHCADDRRPRSLPVHGQ